MQAGSPPFIEAEVVTKARSVAARLALSELPILITGQVGTGRRTLAAALAESRAARGRVVVTASAFDGLPQDVRDNADRWVLVLNHVDVLDARKQAELASLVRDSKLLLVATGKEDMALSPDLSALVDATTVCLPPLRDRGDDAAHWAELFAKRVAAELGVTSPQIAPKARLAIAAHGWPGNLSELESVVRRAVLLRSGDVLEPTDLGFDAGFVVQPLTDAVDQFRMAYVGKVLEHFGGNRTQAARALGIDARTMFRYVAKARGDAKE